MKGLFLFESAESIELLIRVFWSGRRHDADTIHDTVYVRIDAYIGHIIEDREDDLRGFDPDSWEGLEEYEVIRDDAVIFSSETQSCRMDMARLIAKKIHILEISFEFLY